MMLGVQRSASTVVGQYPERVQGSASAAVGQHPKQVLVSASTVEGQYPERVQHQLLMASTYSTGGSIKC